MTSSSLKEFRFHAADYLRVAWAINPEYGTTLEDMLDPKYWANVARKLKPWARIEARAEDGSYFYEFLVRDAGTAWAKVALINKQEFGDVVAVADVNVADKYVIKWGGPQYKFRVLRADTKQVLKEHFVNKEDASKWIFDHEKAFLPSGNNV